MRQIRYVQYGEMSYLHIIKQIVLDRLKQSDDPDLWYDLFYDILKSEGKSYAQWRVRQIRLKDQQMKFKFPRIQ
jgi:hypothetical protein